jgi:hypothetical protein
MRSICVFLRPDLIQKWLVRDVNWMVCQECQKNIRRGSPDADMLAWWPAFNREQR